jgi:hypothetical protein
VVVVGQGVVVVVVVTLIGGASKQFFVQLEANNLTLLAIILIE